MVFNEEDGFCSFNFSIEQWFFYLKITSHLHSFVRYWTILRWSFSEAMYKEVFQ